jgi:hypothetical protein
MIKKEDIKVGLEFYITRKNCLKCNFDPLFVHDDNIPVLFRIERNDDCTYLCTSADSNHEFFAHFDTESIMKFGVAIAAGGESRNEKTEQVSHPSHYAWLKDLCGVEPLDICRHLDFNTGNAIKYLLRKDKVDGNKTKTEKRIEDLRKAVFYIQDEIKLFIGTWNNRLITLARIVSSSRMGFVITLMRLGLLLRRILLAQISSIRK